MVITHPFHPFTGQRVEVVQFCPRAQVPRVVVELPNAKNQSVPCRWTDLEPAPGVAPGLPRPPLLFAPALLEIAALLAAQCGDESFRPPAADNVL